MNTLIDAIFPPFVPTGQVKLETLRWFQPMRTFGHRQEEPSSPLNVLWSSSLYHGDIETREWRMLMPGQSPDVDWLDRYLRPLRGCAKRMEAGETMVLYLDSQLESFVDELLECAPGKFEIHIMPSAPAAIGMLWRYLPLAEPGWKWFMGADKGIVPMSERTRLLAAAYGNYTWVRSPNSFYVLPNGSLAYMPIGGDCSTNMHEPDIANIMAEYVDWFKEHYPGERFVVKHFPPKANPWGYGVDEEFLARWAYADVRANRSLAVVARQHYHPLVQLDLADCPNGGTWWI